MARIYVRGPVLERMMRRRIVVGEDPVLCCWRWNGAHSKKTRKGYRDSPSRPVVRLGPGLGIYPVARLMLSFHDGVPLDQRGDLESGHVKCANPWCWNPHHLAWRSKEENIEDRRRQYGHAWGRRPADLCANDVSVGVAP